MDYYQGVVVEYLRADRSVFVNTECCIQVNEAMNPDTSGPHWFCDAVAVDFERPRTVYLCEISYAQSLGALFKRLASWNGDWTRVVAGLRRDCLLPEEWPVRPWLFVPTEVCKTAVARIQKLGVGAGQSGMPVPKITPLEFAAPWKYRSWNRIGEEAKPDCIPNEMK